MERYGKPDAPVVFKGFEPASSNFDRSRTGLHEPFEQSLVVFTTNSGTLDLNIAGNFLMIDSYGTLEMPKLTTIELNAASDVPHGQITIGRGLQIRSPFTSVRIQWTGGQASKGFRLLYATDAALNATGLIDVQAIASIVNIRAGGTGGDFLNGSVKAALSVQPFAYSASNQALPVVSQTALTANQVVQVAAPAATDAYIFAAQAISVGTGLTQVALVVGPSAPANWAALTSGYYIVALSKPTMLNGTSVHSVLELSQPMRVGAGNGIWWVNSPTAETTGTRAVVYQSS